MSMRKLPVLFWRGFPEERVLYSVCFLRIDASATVSKCDTEVEQRAQ